MLSSEKSTARINQQKLVIDQQSFINKQFTMGHLLKLSCTFVQLEIKNKYTINITVYNNKAFISPKFMQKNK
jgi:hypothetical protein